VLESFQSYFSIPLSGMISQHDSAIRPRYVSIPTPLLTWIIAKICDDLAHFPTRGSIERIGLGSVQDDLENLTISVDLEEVTHSD